MSRTEGIYRHIGRRLREVREGQRLSQEEVAKQLGISSVGYGRWESAERRIHIAELHKVADVLGKPVAYFLGEDLTPDKAMQLRYQSLNDEDRRLVSEMVELLTERRRKSNAVA